MKIVNFLVVRAIKSFLNCTKQIFIYKARETAKK